MVQIIEQAPGIGEALGAGFSGTFGPAAQSSYSSGLKMLADAKMKGMQQAQQIAALQSLGLPPELAVLPPQAQGQFIKQQMRQQNYERLLGGEPGYAEAIGEQLQGGQPVSIEEGIAGAPAGALGMLDATQEQRAPTVKQPTQSQQTAMGPPSGDVEEQALVRLTPQGDAEIVQTEELVAPWEGEVTESPSPRQILAAGALDEGAARRLEGQAKRSLQEQKLSVQKEQNDIKRNQKWIDETESSYDRGIEDLKSLGLMNDAILSGEIGVLSRANLSEMLPDWGILKPLKRGLMTGAGQQFKSASKAIFKSLKEIFGARPTNIDVKILEDMFGKIGQSVAANLVSTKIIEAGARLRVAKGQIYQQLREANPRASETQLRRETTKRYRKYQDELWNRIEKDVAQYRQGNVAVVSPDGKRSYLPESMYKQALEAGYRLS
ncbi:MAG: hypothetical protein PVF65_06000 [Sphingomonadales bacterium]|jgi:hypothetical protein